jgi:hypothetical protein
MRLLTLYIYCFIVTALYSCKNSQTDFAIQWTNEIKEKIIADASVKPDRSQFDSTYYTLTIYNGDTKLKQFILRPKLGTITKKVISVDTLVSTFYSADQKFELVRELCPAIERSFEGVNYQGTGSVGLTEFRFCNGRIKERGFRYGFKPVGVWTKYDSTGKVIEEKDNGNILTLDELHNIKYYR